MQPTPTVSVAIPSYNHARFISRTLDSVFKQTHLPSEVLIIDDGSKDDSVAVIRQGVLNAPVPVTVSARENRGLCRTLNEALVRTNSKYFAYIGSDDLWAPERLQLGVEALERSPEAVAAYSHCYFIDSDDQLIGATAAHSEFIDGELLPRLLEFRSVPPSPTVLYRRSALESVRFNEASRLEDFELYLRLSAIGQFRFIPKHLGYWRIHAGNTSGALRMMVDERKAAVRRVAPSIGLTEEQIRRASSLSDWLYATEFLSSGERMEALVMSLTNAWAAPSLESVARRTLQLATPSRILRWRTARLSREHALRAQKRGQ